MSNKNLLSGRDKELQELAEQYESAMSAKQTILSGRRRFG